MGSNRFLAATALCLGLAGCSADVIQLAAFGEPVRNHASHQGRIDRLPNAELVATGKLYFRDRDYGNAQAAYQKAVEIYPENAEAWLGLAASYDQLRRFDQSKLAYKRLHALVGGTSAFYNNRGFSLLLQSDVRGAITAFKTALRIDPTNQVAENNLELIRQLSEAEARI
ncbi:MAG: tetratricopeptide repeat protein [Pseudomonadota bacterium]